MKGNQILSPKSEYKSSAMSFQTNFDLGSWEIRKFLESPWNAWNWLESAQPAPTKQILTVVLQNWEKSAVKHSL